MFARARLVLMVALVLIAGGGLFLACGVALGPAAGAEICDGGACDAGASPEAPEASTADAIATADVGSTLVPDGGRDAGRLAPCGDGGLPGALDPSFGDGGMVFFLNPDPSKGWGCGAVLIQPDGKTLLAGGVGTIASNNPHFLLARLTPTGALDTGFGDGGMVDTPIPLGTGGAVDALALTGDGRVLAGGEATGAGVNSFRSFAIGRYSRGGAIDPTFGDGGLAFVNFSLPEHAFLHALVVLPDGSVLAAGYVATYGSLASDYLIAKLDPKGSLDPTFGAGGIVRIDIGYVDDGNAIVVQPDGKILLAGWSAPVVMVAGKPTTGRKDLSVVRLSPDGSLDPSFGSAGKVVLALATPSYARTVVLDSIGRIVLGGSTGKGNDFAVFRLTPTGALDSTFGSAGVASTDFDAGVEVFRGGLSIQVDGTFVMAGVTFTPSEPRDALARFLSDGAPDPGFADGGRIVVPNPGGYYVRSHSAASAGGRTTVAGQWAPPVGHPLNFGVSRYCL